MIIKGLLPGSSVRQEQWLMFDQKESHVHALMGTQHNRHTHLSVLVEPVPGVGVLNVGVGLEQLFMHHALDRDL